MMSILRMDQLIWVFIFVGLFVGGLGLSIARSDDTLGWSIGGAGALLFVAGAAMLWARSRSEGNAP
jgi:protein-S-isoprenylcysteine O-methyltransferase Ste14